MMELTQADPRPSGKSAWRRAVLVGSQITLGTVCLVGSYAGASWLFSGLAEPPPPNGVRLARVEDWPEIKNGVPELIRPKAPPATNPITAIAPSTAPDSSRISAAAEVDRTGSSQRADPLTEAKRVGREPSAAQQASPMIAAPLSPPPTPAEADPGRSAAPETVVAAPPAEVRASLSPPIGAPGAALPTIASLPEPVATGTNGARPAAASPARTESARPSAKRAKKAEPRKERTAGAERKPGVASRSTRPRSKVAAVAPQEPEPAKVEDERVRVFGVPLPFIPTGRQIKETVEAITGPL